MRVSILSNDNTPTINVISVHVLHENVTLISMNITIPERERNPGVMHTVMEVVEPVVRRMLKGFYPGLRGVRTVIYV